jgi:hypothetical protein
VLEELTMPNVLLNIPMTAMTNGESPSPPETRFFAGDWASLLATILGPENRKYDLILTSETIYNLDNQAKLIDIFKDCLTPPADSSEDEKSGGEVLVAAKSFYFGVGGGLQEFRRRLESDGFGVDVMAKSETGVSRQILRAIRN